MGHGNTLLGSEGGRKGTNRRLGELLLNSKRGYGRIVRIERDNERVYQKVMRNENPSFFGVFF